MALDDNNVTLDSFDQTTVQSVFVYQSTLNLPCPDICVICLELVSERAIALPCKHDQFDLPCLGTWLQHQRSCPLCKVNIQALQIQNARKDGIEIIQLPDEVFTRRSRPEVQRSLNGDARRRRRYQEAHYHSPKVNDSSLARRKEVYSRRLYSFRVGTNRISGYKNLTPDAIRDDSDLIAKARKWIRRELAVFEFLDPYSEAFGRVDRRASNAEYLQEYIIAILKAIDLKGSSGQAIELLKDFLGKEYATLFLHELESWLRSPFEKLADWDRNVQYHE